MSEGGSQDEFYGRHGQGRPTPYQRPFPPPEVPPMPPPFAAPSQLAPELPVSPPPPRPSWWRRHLAVIVPWVLVAALAVTVVILLLPPSDESKSSSEPATVQVTVNFLLSDSDTARSGCEGDGGYGDIGSGTPVTIKNGSGDILGATSLGSGTAASGSCLWQVKVADVPAGERFYSAEVGSRGAITQSASELAANDYAFDVSLGD